MRRGGFSKIKMKRKMFLWVLCILFCFILFVLGFFVGENHDVQEDVVLNINKCCVVGSYGGDVSNYTQIVWENKNEGVGFK